MTGHADLSPSGAHRWMRCPGSVALCRGLPREDSVYSREGTFAHAVAAACLQEGVDAAQKIGHTDEEFVVDEEMAGYVQVYLDAVRSTAQLMDGDLLVEQRVAVSEHVYGTADAIVYSDDETHVFDFKYGKGQLVTARGNEQLLTYQLGAHKASTASRSMAHPSTGHIVQPRCTQAEHLWRSSTVSTGYLLETWASALSKAEEDAMRPDAPLVPGDHCQFCPAKNFCPKLRDRALETVQSVFTNLDLTAAPVRPPSPATLTPKQISVALAGEKLVTAWFKGVNEMAEDMLARGIDVPGWKLIAVESNRKWRDDSASGPTADALRALGLEPFVPAKLISPSVAERALTKQHGRKASIELLEPFYHREVTGRSVASSGDPRPALLAANPFVPLEN